MRRFLLSSIVFLSLLVLLVTVASAVETAPAAATRTISPSEISAGGTFTVEVEIQISGVVQGGLALAEDLPQGFAAGEVLKDGGATVLKNRPEGDLVFFWGLQSFSAGDVIHISYQAKAPQVGGSYTINGKLSAAVPQFEVAVGGATQITVSGGGARTIEQAVAGHSGDPQIIDDADILWAVELWIEGTPVPGTNGQVIDDDEVLKLVELWIEGGPVS